MNISKHLLAGAILTALSTSAFAAEKENELSLYGSIMSTTPSGGSSTTTTVIDLSYGRYVTDQLLLTVSDFIMASGSSPNATVLDNIGIGAKYYLSVGRKGEFVPFAEGGMAIGSMSAGSGAVTSTAVGFMIGAGASYFVTETASFDGRFNFISQSVSTSTAFGSTTSSQTETLFTVGLTQRF